MKQKVLFSRLALLAILFIGGGILTNTAWAESVTYTMSIDGSVASGKNDVHWTSESETLTYDNVTWDVYVDQNFGSQTPTTYVQIGSKGNPAKKITISTSAFAGKKITAASLNGYCLSTTGPALTITAGETVILNSEAFVKSTLTKYSANANLPVTLGSTDVLTFEINSSAKAAICISGISVTYEESTEPSTEPSISVDPATVNVTSAETSGEIVVTYNNITNVTSELKFYEADGTTEATYDWLDAEINSNGNIDYVIAANTGEARTAYLKVYALDDDANEVCSDLITVTQEAYKAPFSGGKYVKVTSTDDLTSGQYLIVYEDGNAAFNGGLTTLDAVSNTISVTISDSKITATDETVAAEFTIDVNAGTIKSASGYYIGQASDANALTSDQTTTYTNTISISTDGNADIVSEGGAYLRYNASSNQERFRYYKSSSYTNQKAIALYKRVESVTVSDKGYATYCSENALDFENTGITAYVGTISGTALTFTPIQQVPANTGVLLVASGGATVDVPIIVSATAVANNCLTGVNEATTLTANDYILNVKDGKAGFYKAGDFTALAAHRAYIPALTAGNVKSFYIDLEDAPTGIGSVENVGLATDGAIYNLAGQRLQKMQKGINIVNGKKILK